jgi:hypothetical protein
MVEHSAHSKKNLKLKRATLATYLFIGFTFLFPKVVQSQSRVDLEDLKVRGELLNDRRMRVSSREPARVQDRIKYRKNFRSEIIDGIDLRLPAAETLEEVEAK